MDFFKKSSPRKHSVDDLILLGKYPEAEEKLRQDLRENPDPQLRLKLGDVLRKLGRGDDAVSEYLGASDKFLDNGFVDRARAAATRARKLAPHRTDIDGRFKLMDRRKRLDLIRNRALEALCANERDEGAAAGKLEVEGAWDTVSRCDWIDSLQDRQLIHILRGMRVEKFAAGKRLIAEGSLARSLFLLATGEVEARRIGPKGMAQLRTFISGDILGERALLDRTPWGVTLVALTECKVLILDAPGFEGALVGNEDPRGLIESLRAQRLDEEVARLVDCL